MILAFLSILTKTQLKVACKKQSNVLVEVTGRLRHSWNKESNDVRLLSSHLLLGSLPMRAQWLPAALDSLFIA